MKKLGLAVVFAALSVFGLQAQNPSELIQFGVKGGVNFATLSGDDVENAEMRTAFYAGGMVEIPYSERFSIQPEVMYSAQGATRDFMGVEETSKFDYIQIPILAKYYLAPGFSLQVGPQVGFRLNESIEYSSENFTGSFSPKEEYNENDVDFGIAAGLGYKFSNGFLIQARYNYGITDAIPNTNARNSVIQVGVGFMF